MHVNATEKLYCQKWSARRTKQLWGKKSGKTLTNSVDLHEEWCQNPHYTTGTCIQHTTVYIGTLEWTPTRSNKVVLVHYLSRSNLCYILGKCYAYGCSASDIQPYSLRAVLHCFNIIYKWSCYQDTIHFHSLPLFLQNYLGLLITNYLLWNILHTFPKIQTNCQSIFHFNIRLLTLH